MNRITIFTPLSGDAPRYGAVRKSKKWSLELKERERFRAFSSAEEPELCYVDLAGAAEEEAGAILRSLLRKSLANTGVGLIDPAGLVADPAHLFHKGLADYLGPAACDRELSPKRLETVLAFAAGGGGGTQRQVRVSRPGSRGASAAEKGPAAGASPSKRSAAASSAAEEGAQAGRVSEGLGGPPVRSGPVTPEGPEEWPRTRAPAGLRRVAGWEEIQPSREYTFWMMYVELDEAERYRRTTSDAQATTIFEAFRGVVERYAEDFHGRIWMWKEAGGVVLFPFDGVSPGAVVTAVRLVLNRTLISVEDIPVRSSVSYRVALHLGNTVFEQKGRTGTIVSDAVNLLFHLGQRYTGPGTLSMTEQAAHYAAPGLVPYFEQVGVFEGSHVYRMRPIVRTSALAQPGER